MTALTETIVSEVINQIKDEMITVKLNAPVEEITKQLEALDTLIKPATVTNPLHLAKSSEHGTPQNIIELSRVVLDGIDLDPFSSEKFNYWVKAYRFFNRSDDGLRMAWFQPTLTLSDGKGYESVEKWKPVSVFLNPPSKLKVQNAKGKIIQKSGAKESWKHLMQEVSKGHITHAIVIAYSLEQLQVTQNGCVKSMVDYPFCISKERFDYVNDQGVPQTNGSHSSAIIYVPNLIDNSQKFKELFSSVGKVLGV